MHTKNIRRIVTKQLKKTFPNWNKMTRKSKKELTKQIMMEVVETYDYSQTLDIPIEELIGIEDQALYKAFVAFPRWHPILKIYSDNLFHFDALKKPCPEIRASVRSALLSCCLRRGYHHHGSPYKHFPGFQ